MTNCVIFLLKYIYMSNVRYSSSNKMILEGYKNREFFFYLISNTFLNINFFLFHSMKFDEFETELDSDFCLALPE